MLKDQNNPKVIAAITDVVKSTSDKTIQETTARSSSFASKYSSFKPATMVAAKNAVELTEAKKLDPVGKEDADIDNDGDTDKSDEYLHNRRKAIKKAMKEDADQVDEQRFEKGEDVGRPGLNFKKIAKEAGKKYGSKEAGQRVAGAILKKVLRKEEVEQIDELSVDTMKAAHKELKFRAYDAHMDDNKAAARDYAGRALHVADKIKKKEKDLKNEETDQIDEISSDLAKRYASKAHTDMVQHATSAQGSRKSASDSRSQAGRLDMRGPGVGDSTRKLAAKQQKSAEDSANVVKKRAVGLARATTRMKEGFDLDEARGRPRKDASAGDDNGPEPDAHIHVQLKKAADSVKDDMGGKGGADVKFDNGSQFVHSEHAKKVLDALDKLKPADREKLHNHIKQSHANFQAVHKLVS